MAGVVSRLPMLISGRAAVAGSVTYSLTDAPYDFALGGMPFMSAISDDRPYSVSMAPIRKDQFDNQREPGEQSLANWWLRSQSTFIGGAGLLYQDPDQVQVANLQNKHTIQYGSSVGINPWVNGQATLLRQTSQRIADSSSNTQFLVGWNDGTDRYWSAVGNVLKSDTGSATTTITWGGANTIRSLTSDGTNYFAADNVQVYKGAGNGAGAAFTATGTTNVVVRWVKGRLMMAMDNKIYEVSSAGAATLRFTHLNAAFVFTDFAEGTSAIYASGYAGSQSNIYKLTLDTTGAIPTLASGGTITTQLPLGEVVYAMEAYLGTFVGIGTSRGFRVGQIDSNGDIVYGPLLFTAATGVRSVAAYDRFFFVGATNIIDGSSGLYRVDLGQPIQDSGASSASVRFAYATDLQAHTTGTVGSVTNFGNSDRMVFSVTAVGSYLEDALVLETTGYLQTGRIRYSTLEPKLYKFVSVKTPNSYAGTLALSVTSPAGGPTSIMSVSEGSGVMLTDIALAVPTTASEWIQIRLDFGRSTVSTSTGMTVNGWQLKAMPGSVRQRIFQIPLLLMDFEKDQTGQEWGYEGRTADRLEQFRNIVQLGDVVSFQDLTNNTTISVVVDDFKFEQKANPGTNQSVYGGYLYVQLRTIADVITV
jgi:hypothetical protein